MIMRKRKRKGFQVQVGRFVPRPDFWSQVFQFRGDGSYRIRPLLYFFVGFSILVYLINFFIHEDLKLEVAPYEVAGAALGLLLVLRTNAGYDRWWEARKLWGGIVNETRNLAILGVVNGPADPRWKRDIVMWTVAFAHVCRATLRRQKTVPELEALIGAEAMDRVTASQHMPTYVAATLSALLRQARDHGSLDVFAYHQAENQRNILIDHLGGCERILKTPLAVAYSILIRRFIVFFLLTLPFALLPKVGWEMPIITFLVAFPILSLDRIGDELQDPFSLHSMNHLPLDDICATIQGNLLALLNEAPEPIAPLGPPRIDRRPDPLYSWAPGV
jgi:putative membrane protein